MDQEGQRGFLSFASRNKSWGTLLSRHIESPHPFITAKRCQSVILPIRRELETHTALRRK